MSATGTTGSSPSGYDQWISMNIQNVGSKDIKVKNLKVSFGKLYADGDKDKEIDPSTYENYVIHPGDELHINACGREDTPSGTTGDFDLVDPSTNDEKIRHFYWDCPWASSTNEFTVSEANSKWMVEISGPNFSNGPLGSINIVVMDKS